MVTAARTIRPKLKLVKETSYVPAVKHSTDVTPKLKSARLRSRARAHPSVAS